MPLSNFAGNTTKSQGQQMSQCMTKHPDLAAAVSLAYALPKALPRTLLHNVTQDLTKDVAKEAIYC